MDTQDKIVPISSGVLQFAGCDLLDGKVQVRRVETLRPHEVSKLPMLFRALAEMIEQEMQELRELEGA